MQKIILLLLCAFLNSCNVYYNRIPNNIKDSEIKQINELKIANCKRNYIIAPGAIIMIDNGKKIRGKVREIENSKIVLVSGETINLNGDIKKIVVHKLDFAVQVALCIPSLYIFPITIPTYFLFERKVIFNTSSTLSKFKGQNFEVIKTNYEYKKPENVFGDKIKKDVCK